MTIPSWRLALAAGALIVLGAIGGGLVQAAATPAAPAADTTAAPVATTDDTAALLDALAMTSDSGTSSAKPATLLALRDRVGARLARLRQRFVHSTVIVLDADGKPVTHQLDHGTVAAVADGSITITEAGGTSVTVATTADTIVRKATQSATLADLKVGDEVLTRSIVVDGRATAKWVVVPPASPAAAGPSTGRSG